MPNDYLNKPTDLDKVYAPLWNLYRKEQDEIPVAVYNGYTITLRNSWSGTFGIYNPAGERVEVQPHFFNACAEVVRLINNLDEFPYESRFDIPLNPYYDEAVELQLQYCDLVSAIQEQMRRDVIWD